MASVNMKPVLKNALWENLLIFFCGPTGFYNQTVDSSE